MHFSEDDLKNALRRKDPGPGFTQRVMARVSQNEKTKAPLQPKEKQAFWPLWAWKLRPVWIGVAAALVLAGGGLGYRQYERIRTERAQAELVRQQVTLALRIANTKLNHVLKRVSQSMNEPAAQQPKIRRQSL